MRSCENRVKRPLVPFSCPPDATVLPTVPPDVGPGAPCTRVHGGLRVSVRLRFCAFPGASRRPNPPP